MYGGPLAIRSIQEIQIAPLDCDVGPDETIFGEVSMKATGAMVCTNKRKCGSDYLELDEYELNIPQSDEPDPDVDYQKAILRGCDGHVSGTVYADGATGRVAIGQLSTGRDNGPTGCTLYISPEQAPNLDNMVLEILVVNSGTLLENEDYAPAMFSVEYPLTCK